MSKHEGPFSELGYSCQGTCALAQLGCHHIPAGDASVRKDLVAKRDALVANYGKQRDALLADLLPEVGSLQPLAVFCECSMPAHVGPHHYVRRLFYASSPAVPG
jgi:hypothetical protein